MRKIKLIWDFRGSDAQKIAEHQEIHLKDYVIREKLGDLQTGIEILNQNHVLAFVIVNEDQMLPVRDALKPHRGVFHD